MNKYKTKFKNPKGFKVVITKSLRTSGCGCDECSRFAGQYDYTVKLYHKQNGKKTVIGSVRLYPYHKSKNKLCYETHSNLESRFHGQGLGSLLYKRAIEFCHHNSFIISSSQNPSMFAQRVWKSNGLKQHFYIRNRNYRTYSYSKFIKGK